MVMQRYPRKHEIARQKRINQSEKIMEVIEEDKIRESPLSINAAYWVVVLLALGVGNWLVDKRGLLAALVALIGRAEVLPVLSEDRALHARPQIVTPSLLLDTPQITHFLLNLLGTKDVPHKILVW